MWPGLLLALSVLLVPATAIGFPRQVQNFSNMRTRDVARSSAGPLSAPGPCYSHRLPAPGTEFQQHEDWISGQVVFCWPSQCSWSRLQPQVSRARYKFSATRGLKNGQAFCCQPSECSWFQPQPQASRARYRFSATRGLEMWPGRLLLAFSVLLVPATAIGFPRQVQNFSSYQ